MHQQTGIKTTPTKPSASTIYRPLHMNFSPYQWRADNGYLPPPGSMPQPIYPYQPMYYYGNSALHYQPYPGPYVAISPPKKQPSVASTPGPSPPKKPTSPPAPAKKTTTVHIKHVFFDKSIAILPSIAPGESSTGGSSAKPPKSTKTTTVAHSANSMKPPSVRPGTNYMFPKEHTMLHIFSKAAPVWEEKYRSQKLDFKIFKVYTGVSVKEVVERVLRTTDEGKCKGWGVTEVFEGGEGVWRKGTTTEHGSDKAKSSLNSMGWNAKRGAEGGRPPVWLTVHKIPEKK